MPPPAIPTPYSLTFQEVKIILYIKEGLSSQQIADQLSISVSTVKTHRKNIMKKVCIKGKTAFTQFVFSFTPPFSIKKTIKCETNAKYPTKIPLKYYLGGIVEHPTY